MGEGWGEGRGMGEGWGEGRGERDGRGMGRGERGEGRGMGRGKRGEGRGMGRGERDGEREEGRRMGRGKDGKRGRREDGRGEEYLPAINTISCLIPSKQHSFVLHHKSICQTQLTPAPTHPPTHPHTQHQEGTKFCHTSHYLSVPLGTFGRRWHSLAAANRAKEGVGRSCSRDVCAALLLSCCGGGMVRVRCNGGVVRLICDGGVVRVRCDGGVVRVRCDGGVVRVRCDGGMVGW